VSKSNLPRYEVALPPFTIKKKSLANLSVDAIVDLNLSELEFWLIQQHICKAKAKIIQHPRGYKLEIINNTPIQIDKKVAFVATLGEISSRSIEIKHKIDISMLNFDNIQLKHHNKTIATAKMAMSDDKIVLIITKVIR
jgi:hypothetical protein